MAEINEESYRQIATLYADAMQQIANVSDYYYSAATEVLLTDVFAPEIDLLVPFYNAYKMSLTAYSEAPSAAVEAVRVLQNHVLTNAVDGAGDLFTDINDWYDLKGIVVDQEFADMSDRAGYAIDAGNIA